MLSALPAPRCWLKLSAGTEARNQANLVEFTRKPFSHELQVRTGMLARRLRSRKEGAICRQCTCVSCCDNGERCGDEISPGLRYNLIQMESIWQSHPGDATVWGGRSSLGGRLRCHGLFAAADETRQINNSRQLFAAPTPLSKHQALRCFAGTFKDRILLLAAGSAAIQYIAN